MNATASTSDDPGVFRRNGVSTIENGSRTLKRGVRSVDRVTSTHLLIDDETGLSRADGPYPIDFDFDVDVPREVPVRDQAGDILVADDFE